MLYLVFPQMIVSCRSKDSDLSYMGFLSVQELKRCSLISGQYKPQLQEPSLARRLSSSGSHALSDLGDRTTCSSLPSLGLSSLVCCSPLLAEDNLLNCFCVKISQVVFLPSALDVCLAFHEVNELLPPA